jgi:hypothetical protein
MEEKSGNSKLNPFGWMFPRIQAFINDTLCKEDVSDDLYVEGATRIEFFAAQLRREASLDIEEHRPPSSSRPNEFEEALFERLLQPREFNLLVLLGGLGAGKTTTVKYLLRRFNDRRQQMMREFKCVCTECFRSPIYLDFRALGQHRAIRKESVVTDVFRQLRLRTYQQLVLEWLQRSNNSVKTIQAADPQFVVLRRLLIANDLLRFHGGDHIGLSNLYDSDLVIDAPLTSKTLSDKELIDLINHYRPAAEAYDPKIQKVSHDPDHSQDFMALTLQFYLYGCNLANPMNLIVLDNLDQLPTLYIEELLSVLHDLATHTSGLPLLVPLRPSSINPYGFVREILFRYHYGPNNYHMILSRLRRYILTQSRDQLKVPRSEADDKPFPTIPSDNEIDALLVVAYLYAKIMAGGMKYDLVPGIDIHPDHAFLQNINIGKGAVFGLAETSDALVGACCRYGLDLLRRFFDNIYGNPAILQRAISIRPVQKAGRRVRLRYPDLITSLLRDPIGGSTTSRVANLFRPTRVTSNAGWPTLVKLRILSLLSRERRQEVRSIIQRLGLLGIPTELTIAALNSLQDKFRLLLWFSTNRTLSTEDPSSLSQDVVISEHGERYFRRVVGDFEYVWYCATALQDRKYTHQGLNFTVKLNDYRTMIQRLGMTEWKQIGFSRLRAGSLADFGGVGYAAQMEVLNVLYSSLGRAVMSVGIAMRVHSEKRRLIDEFSPLIIELCEQILFWQKRYQMAYGSNFYISVYERHISDLQHEMLDLHRKDTYGLQALDESLSKVQQSWLKEQKSVLSVNLAQLTEMPHEDLVTLIAKYGRGVFPGLRDWVNSVDKQRRITIFISRFVKTRGQLSALLESRLPTYSELVRFVSYLLGDTQAVVLNTAEVAATDEGLLRWFVDERALLQEINDILVSNNYDPPELCNMQRMTELKDRYNNIIRATEKLARHLGVSDTEHLSYQWQ